MANKKGNKRNLKPIRSVDEARKKGAKGGKASGEARRVKRTLKDKAKLLLSLPVVGNNKELMDNLGVPSVEQDNDMLLLVGLYKKAMGGDASATRLYLEIAGKAPIKDVNINGNIKFDNGELAEIIECLKEDKTRE